MLIVFCEWPGHTTMTCPHRVAIEHGVIPAPRTSTHNTVEYVLQRQLRPRILPVSCLLSFVFRHPCALFFIICFRGGGFVSDGGTCHV